MKPETFEQAKQIEVKLENIDKYLHRLRVPDGKLINITIQSKDDNYYLSFYMEIKEGQFYNKNLNEKTCEMIALLSQTYRDQIISLIQKNKRQLEADFEMLEDLS